MQAQIKLVQFVANDQHSHERHVWPLVVQATGANIASEIFVYQATAKGDAMDAEGDTFSCIASANQMYELPNSRSLTLTDKYQLPFYRTAQLEVFCRSPEEMNEVWSFIQEDVQRLLDNYNITTGPQPNNSVTLVARQVASSCVVDEAPLEDVTADTGNLITLNAGSPVIVQALPPNASYASYTWVQTDPITGNAIRAYTFFPSSSGGDNNWHSELVTYAGDVETIQQFVEAPGI